MNGKMIKVLIIGKGNSDYIETLKRKVDAEGISERIIFDSFKPYEYLYRYLSISDVCLAPFRLTATSNTVECGKLITYLLAGKKTLSTKAAGVSSLYRDTIYYFKDGDYDDFSRRLLMLIQEKEQSCDILRRRQLGEKFDFRKIIEYEYVIIDEYFKDASQDFSKYDYM